MVLKDKSQLFFAEVCELLLRRCLQSGAIRSAQSYQSINQVELNDDFYTRSKRDTIKALTHTSLVLKRMSEKEFHSCDNAFFLSSRNGLILVVKQLTEYVKGVLLHIFYLNRR